MSKDTFAEFLIDQVNQEEAKRISARNIKKKREEAERQRRLKRINYAKEECNRVYDLYKKTDEKGLLGTLSMEKVKNIFINLHRSCDDNPNLVLDKVNIYELILAENTEEVKLTKIVEQEIRDANALNFLKDLMEYLKYYSKYREIEKVAIEWWTKDSNVNMDAIIELLTKKFPFPYNKCTFTEREKDLFCFNPTQAKKSMYQMKMWGLI